MRTLTSLCAVLIVSLWSASASAEGWYVAMGFGPTTIDNQLSEQASGDGQSTVRMAVGRRFTRWALEAFFMGTELSEDGFSETEPHTLSGYGLSARYNFPLSPRFEVYLRGGLHKTELTAAFTEEYEGRAVHYGAGLHFKNKVRPFAMVPGRGLGPEMNLSLFIETNKQFTRLHQDGRASIDADLNSLLFGVSLGRDF